MSNTIKGFAEKNVWSRSARRHAVKTQDEVVDESSSDDSEMALGLKIYVTEPPDVKEAEIIIRWLKGHDSILFESFCGMLRRKVENKNGLEL